MRRGRRPSASLCGNAFGIADDGQDPGRCFRESRRYPRARSKLSPQEQNNKSEPGRQRSLIPPIFSLPIWPFSAIRPEEYGIFEPMKQQPILFLFSLFFLLTATPALADNPLRPEILPKAAKQGEVCLVRVAGPKNVKYLEGEFQRVKISMNLDSAGKAYEGLLAVDMDTKPARYQVKVRGTDQGGKSLAGASSLEVKKVSFKTQTLSLPSSMVDLDPKTLERVNGETKRVEAIFQRARKEKLWKGPFLRPVQGEISTPFGLRRIINSQNKSPHSGVDLRANEGTPILASNSGAVVLVDDLFFSGKSVVLDHGQGIYSMYFHLSEIIAREGEKISKGDVMGQVGSTGRSTGPHLHWGVRVHGSKVDPFSLLRVTETMRD